MKALCTIALLLLSLPSWSKVINGEQSKPINFEKVGWNKIIILNNGNTALLHFEVKKMNLKIYDAKREEIVHREYTAADFNTHWLRDLKFKGIFESNGEIVLFTECFINSKHGLNRIRFEEATGIIKQDTLLLVNGHGGESNSFYVLKDNYTDNYAVFSCRDILHNPDAKLELFRYSGNHILTTVAPVHISYKNPDIMKLLTIGITESDDIYFVIGITGKPLSVRSNQFHHQAAFGFCPRNSNTFLTRTLDLPDVVNPLIVEKNAQTGNDETYSFNEKFPFVVGQAYDTVNHQLNIITVDPILTIGTDHIDQTYLRRACKYVMLTIDPADMSMAGHVIYFENADNQVKNRSGDGHVYQAIPATLFSKQNKLMLVSENYSLENLGELAVTRFNEQMEQVWDTTMPRNKHTGYLSSPEDFFNTNNDVNDLQMAQYDGIRAYATDSLVYIFYNANNVIKTPGETPKPNAAPQYTPSNGYCYAVNESGEYMSILPFGPLAKNETKACLLESATYRADKHTFACLVEDKKGDNTSYYVAWCYLTNFIKE